MTNTEIAKLLREIAACFAIKDAKKYYFQMIAYQKAADTIEQSPSEVSELISEDKLKDLPGIGKTMIDHLEELTKTGQVKHFKTIKKEIPSAVFPLIVIPKIGPKTAFKLVTTLKLKNPDSVIDDLEDRVKKGDVAKIEGLGEKSSQQILQSIAEFRKGKTKTARMVLPFAYEISQKVMAYLKKCPEVKRIEPLGSLRRMVETVGDIDIAVASENPKEVISFFTKYPYIERLIEAGPSTSSFLTSGGKQVDLMVQPVSAFGALLQHFTGSKTHNIHLRKYAQSKGLSLSERGIKIADSPAKLKLKGSSYDKTLKIHNYAKENDFYEAIGLSFVPPELREDTGEIELAIKHQLPKLIEQKEIKGDLHTHSSFNIEPSHDLGGNTVLEMAKKAETLGYEYIGFAEHNPSVNKHTKEQIYTLLTKRNREIEQIQKSTKSVHLLKLLEVDILPDGKLAIDDKTAGILDGLIVSIHSSFSLPAEVMTKRIINALSHPKARILGHPTGRLLGQRESVDANWPQIMEYCKKFNKAMEINAWPTRLDLPDFLIRVAIKMGVKLIINTDSHAKDQMEVMKFGVMQARRGWCKKEDILNSLPYEKFRKWLIGV